MDLIFDEYELHLWKTIKRFFCGLRDKLTDVSSKSGDLFLCLVRITVIPIQSLTKLKYLL